MYFIEINTYRILWNMFQPLYRYFSLHQNQKLYGNSFINDLNLNLFI